MSETATMTIVEFLTARLDEQGQAVLGLENDLALAINGSYGSGAKSDYRWAWYGLGLVFGPIHDGWRTEMPEVKARVLADIAAKRAIVEWCGERDQIWAGTVADDPELPKVSDFAPGHLKNPADSVVLRHLAAVYADHPDYQQEWKP